MILIENITDYKVVDIIEMYNSFTEHVSPRSLKISKGLNFHSFVMDHNYHPLEIISQPSPRLTHLHFSSCLVFKD